MSTTDRTTGTPSDIVDRLLRDITGGQWDRLPALYAPDAVVELPFAGPGGARLTGREEIVAHFERARHAPLTLRLAQVTIHQTADAEVVVAEYEYEARAPRTDARRASRTFRWFASARG